MVTIIREAPFSVFLAMVGVPLAMVAAALMAGWHARRRAALVAATTTTPVGMAEDGYRTFEGQVEAIGGETVRAPLTGAECCWYSATVEEWRRSLTRAENRSEWQVVRQITSRAPFFIRDRTGVCTVRVYGAEVTPTDKSQWKGATFEPEERNPPRVPAGGSTHGMLQVSGGPQSRYRYFEERIYPGDPLTVLGLYSSHRFDPPDLDDIPSALPMDEPPPQPAGARPATTPAADAQSATLDPSVDPWQAADDERFDTLSAKALEVTTTEIEKGERGQPLVITALTAETHTAMLEMGSQAAFMVALLPLAIALWVLLARFG